MVKPRKPIPRKRERPRTTKGLFDKKPAKRFISPKRATPRTSKGLFEKKQGKTDEWSVVREELKLVFARWGIDYCELRYEGCTGRLNWSFAHSMKRYEWSTDPEQRYLDIREVIYACTNCHGVIERRGNKEMPDGRPRMCDIVRAKIKEREADLSKWISV
jgi:hypothetical protein